MVLAGGAGGRLGLLTQQRAKPAVPYGGIYRLIDFPLSNCLHSGYEDVWVVEQFNPVSLSDHLANGRPWDLDRTEGGLLVLHPHLGADRGGWHQGTADALWRNAQLVRDFSADALLVLSADAVYRLDYRDVVESHLETDAHVTMVTTRVEPEDAGRYGVVQVAGDGRITGYAYKPDQPEGDLVSNEVFVFRPDPVLDTLDEIADEAGDDSEELSDLGAALLPRLVEDGRARQHRMPGYWRDVGTVDSYWEAHMDLLEPDPAFELDDPEWPILSRARQRPPARVARGAALDTAYLSPGSIVRGRVERSVIGPGVVVEQGATVRDAVLLDEVTVGEGATVERAVVDIGFTVKPSAQVGGDDEIALVGDEG
jgi:glucose-1-phosphate adenylyltransferase